ERRHIDLSAGFSYEYVDYYKDTRGYLRGLSGAGTFGEIAAGLLDFLELGGGVGFRFNHDARLIGAERLSRVNREWFPSLAPSPDLWSPNTASAWENASPAGNDWATNPYVRMRIAFVNYGPVRVGIEAWHNLPFVRYSPFSIGVGL